MMAVEVMTAVTINISKKTQELLLLLKGFSRQSM